MNTTIPKGFEDIAPSMKAAHERILSRLMDQYTIEPYPDSIPKSSSLDGEAAAVAYPIQGILKYHGMADWEARTAFLPSISLNNSAAKTVTVVRFDASLPKDQVFINDELAGGRELERAQQTLNLVRGLVKSNTSAEVISKNIIEKNAQGKGLGTSASASAALALAAVHAALGESFSTNMRFVSTVARHLAASGARSVVGGVSAMLSYPGIPHEDAFAVRLDTKEEMEAVSLFTIPIESRIGLKTEMAHKDAPHSPFFKSWMATREKQFMDALQAIRQKDWEKLGALAELDTILLHAVTMSGNYGNKIIAWEPETIRLMRMVNDMRDKDIPVYFSIDTGPTPVLITHSKHELDVANYLELGKFPDFIKGHIAGPGRILKPEELEQELGSQRG